MAYLVLSSVRGTTIGLTSGDLIENISIGIGASKLNSNFGNVTHLYPFPSSAKLEQLCSLTVKQYEAESPMRTLMCSDSMS